MDGCKIFWLVVSSSTISLCKFHGGRLAFTQIRCRVAGWLLEGGRGMSLDFSFLGDSGFRILNVFCSKLGLVERFQADCSAFAQDKMGLVLFLQTLV